MHMNVIELAKEAGVVYMNEESNEFIFIENLPEIAALVRAEAIRDALLFLVERCNEQGFYSPIKQPIVQTALAAIRELK